MCNNNTHTPMYNDNTHTRTHLYALDTHTHKHTDQLTHTNETLMSGHTHTDTVLVYCTEKKAVQFISLLPTVEDNKGELSAK